MGTMTRKARSHLPTSKLTSRNSSRGTIAFPYNKGVIALGKP